MPSRECNRTRMPDHLAVHTGTGQLLTLSAATLSWPEAKQPRRPGCHHEPREVNLLGPAEEVQTQEETDHRQCPQPASREAPSWCHHMWASKVQILMGTVRAGCVDLPENASAEVPTLKVTELGGGRGRGGLSATHHAQTLTPDFPAPRI